MSDEMYIRPATGGEVSDDLFIGDTWTLHRLDIDRRAAATAANEAWGPPGTSTIAGEKLWRLRADEDTPVYLSIGPDDMKPVAMFQLYRRPDPALETAVLSRLRDMLRGDAEGDD